MYTIDVQTPTETEAVGRRIGAMLFPGAVVALIGPLGAGKTYLARAIAIGLGIANADVVSSPTFVLIQEYDAKFPIYHFDAYRLENPDEFVALGVHEYFQGNGVSLVEWADKVRSVLPMDYLEVRIKITGEESRQVEMIAHGARYEAIVDSLLRIAQLSDHF